MENRNDRNLPEASAPEQEASQQYAPRPAWQVWAARVGLVLFLIFVVYQILTIAGGGL